MIQPRYGLDQQHRQYKDIKAFHDRSAYIWLTQLGLNFAVLVLEIKKKMLL